MKRNLNLASNLLLNCVQLATACQSATSAMATPTLPQMLRVALPELSAQSASEWATSTDEPSTVARLLPRLPSLATQIRSVSESTERQAEVRLMLAAIDDLITLRGLVAAPGCEAVKIVFQQQAVFRFLNYVWVSPGGSRPLRVLAGDAPGDADEVHIRPAGQRVLEDLDMAYRPGELFPCWRSDYFMRVPPNPTRQRFADWTPPHINNAATIEFYRSLFAAELPLYRVTNEPIRFPCTIAGPSLELVIDPGESPVTGLRTTLTDIYRVPHLIVEHISDQ